MRRVASPRCGVSIGFCWSWLVEAATWRESTHQEPGQLTAARTGAPHCTMKLSRTFPSFRGTASTDPKLVCLRTSNSSRPSHQLWRISDPAERAQSTQWTIYPDRQRAKHKGRPGQGETGRQAREPFCSLATSSFSCFRVLGAGLQGRSHFQT